MQGLVILLSNQKFSYPITKPIMFFFVFFFDFFKTKKKEHHSESMNCLIIFIAFFHKIVQKSCQSWKFYKIEKSCCQNAKHYLQSPYSKWIPTRSSDLFFSTAEVIDISTLLPRYWAAWFAALISVSCCWILAA